MLSIIKTLIICALILYIFERILGVINSILAQHKTCAEEAAVTAEEEEQEIKSELTAMEEVIQMFRLEEVE